MAQCALASTLLCGCASVRRFDGIPVQSDALYVGDVPPLRQNRAYACGPTCLAAVASHWGVPVSTSLIELSRQGPDATGEDIARLARKIGLQAFAYEGSMEDVRDNLSKGRPLIAMVPMPLVPHGGLVGEAIIDAWNELGPRPSHWVVIIGLLGSNRVAINDPASGPLVIRRDEFEAWWASKEHLCVLVASSNAETNELGLQSDRR